MAEIDPLIFEFHARTGKYVTDIRQTTRTVDQQLGLQEKRVRRLESEMRRSSAAIGGTLKGLAGTLATYFTGRELVGLIDSFTRVQNALRVAGLEGERLAQVQSQLLDLSVRYGVGIEGLADLYGKATDAGRSFGASEAQILQLTESTSQALLITGTSAQQASGAILGLSQALASGTVRAEEYNQINEGGLRPLLQAAAATERFGGDVNKLRAAVVDGTVSSQEFFGAIMAGSAELEGRASKAALTLSGAFQALTSQLTIYFGEASKSSGVTQALASAIQGLANNLDTLIPILAIIATGLGVGLVRNAIAARVAVAGLGATALTTSRALLAAFGGPVGIAITALTVGLSYLAAEQARVSAAAEANAREFLDLGDAARTAARETDHLSAQQVAAKAAAVGLKIDIDRLADSYYKAAVAARSLRIETQQRAVESRARAALTKAAELKSSSRISAPGDRRATVLPQTEAAFGRFNAKSGAAFLSSQEYRDFAEAQATLKAMRVAPLGPEATVAPPTAAPTASVAVPRGRSASGRETRTGPNAADLVVQQANEINRLQQEELQARIRLTEDASERADLEREALALEYQGRKADIESSDLTREQKDAQVAILQSLYGIETATDEQGVIIVKANKSLYAQQIAREEQAQLERERLDRLYEQSQSEQDALRLQYDLADTQAERRALAFKILEAEDAYLREKLQSIITAHTINGIQDQQAKIAQIQLDAVNATAGDRRAAVAQQNEGALARYGRNAKDFDARIEEIAVEKIRDINDSIADALADNLGIKDRFLRDLFSIFLEKNVFGPLAEALGKEGGGGTSLLSGIASALGSLFGGGRASGGPVSAGQVYRVNEGASPGRVEAFQPNVSGQIIPLGRMDAIRGAGGAAGGLVRVVIEEAPGFAARVRTEATGVAVEVTRQAAPEIVKAATAETFRQSERGRL